PCRGAPLRPSRRGTSLAPPAPVRRIRLRPRSSVVSPHQGEEVDLGGGGLCTRAGETLLLPRPQRFDYFLLDSRLIFRALPQRVGERREPRLVAVAAEHVA